MATAGALRRVVLAYAVAKSSSFVRSVAAGAASGTVNSRRRFSGPTFVVTNSVIVRCLRRAGVAVPDEFAFAEVDVGGRQKPPSPLHPLPLGRSGGRQRLRDDAVVGVCHDHGRVRRELAQEVLQRAGAVRVVGWHCGAAARTSHRSRRPATRPLAAHPRRSAHAGRAFRASPPIPPSVGGAPHRRRRRARAEWSACP